MSLFKTLFVGLLFFTAGLAIQSQAGAEPGLVDPVYSHELPEYDSIICGGPNHPPCRELIEPLVALCVVGLAVGMLILVGRRINRCPRL